MAHFPTDCQQLKEIVLENEVARVVVLAEKQLRLQRAFIDWMVLHIVVDDPNAEVRLRNGAEPSNKLIDRDGFQIFEAHYC